MDFKKIISMQKQLDLNIEKTHKVKAEEVINHKIVALIVEIAEFANEIQSFKYWKKNKNINNELILEEFVDGIHFLLSLSIQKNSSTIIEPIVISNDEVLQLGQIFLEASKLKEDFSKEQIEKTFGVYMGIAKIIGLKDKEIESFYIEKNKVNFKRLSTGY
ncbi:MAG: dUTPase [Mycoplasma sp.]|nr:dUTPase [Mycoplasma sp.]